MEVQGYRMKSAEYADVGPSSEGNHNQNTLPINKKCDLYMCVKLKKSSIFQKWCVRNFRDTVIFKN